MYHYAFIARDQWAVYCGSKLLCYCLTRAEAGRLVALANG